MMDAPVIELRNITKKFGDKLVLDDISLCIPENAIYGIIGQSGCGKTTLLKMMIGSLSTTRGEVYYHGGNIKKISNVIKTNYGFASQAHSFYNKLTVRENLMYFGKLYGLDTETINERINVLVDVFKLKEDEDKLGEELSSGMKKRLDISCALIHDPQVLILDEPTADLDPVLRYEIIDLVKKIREYGTTIIITSHLLTDIERICDRVLMINNKRAVEIDAGLAKEDRREICIKFKSGGYNEFINAIRKINIHVEDAYTDSNGLTVITKDPNTLLQAVMSYSQRSKDKIENIDVNKLNLDKYFMRVLREGR